MLGQAVSQEFPSGNIDDFLDDFQTPKQEQNISFDDIIDDDHFSQKDEKIDITMTSSAASAGAGMLTSVIDNVIPIALQVISKSETSDEYKADEADKAELRNALTEYMKLKGGDIPPGVMLIVLLLGIYGMKVPIAIQQRKINKEREILQKKQDDLERREKELSLKEKQQSITNGNTGE